jgi:hypothetical protein
MINPERCLKTTCVVQDRITGLDLLSNPDLPSMLTRLGLPTTTRLDRVPPAWLQQIGVVDTLKRGQWGTSHPEHLDNVTAWGFLGMDRQQLVDLATLSSVQLGGEMSELDDAGTYFDLPPHKITGTGTYYYLCTRNNNFSNRSQKGKIVVDEGAETGEGVGAEGGVVGIVLEDRFPGVMNDEQSILANSDVWMIVPENSLARRQEIGLRVWTSSNMQPVGLANGASDVLEISPATLAAETMFTPQIMRPVGGVRRRDASLSGDLWVEYRVVDASTVWYKIMNAALGAWRKQYIETEGAEPVFTLAFMNRGTTIASVQETLTGNDVIEGIWENVPPEVVRLVEAGTVDVALSLDGDMFVGKPDRVPNSGQPMEVRLPVSPSLTYGKVYFWPATEPAARECVLSGSTSTACNLLRQEIPASVRGGEAVFQVGASQTQPAGGFYQVSEGSNLALIVGVSISAFILAVAIVGGAVYFRKHPDKWDAFRAWGPKKYKSIKRSLASSV